MKNLFSRIPPTGNAIALKRSKEQPNIPASRLFWVQSGTAALAAGLNIAKQHHKSTSPEVILPAYCCPDLLSAILFNNMKPVLVDLEPNTPYMDIECLKASLSENTAAIIAVNFLGIPERLNLIKSTAANYETLLIEDSAQWFPESLEAFSQHQGDIVIYSFGKGKPICLMGGGALAVLNTELSSLQPEMINAESPNTMKLMAKYFAYNAIISKPFYWLLEIAPFIQLGETNYKPLESILEKNAQHMAYLVENIAQYQQRGSDKQDQWQTALSEYTDISVSLPSSCQTYSDQRLLRFPILLMQSHDKSQFIEEARDLGLGASGLYPDILPNIHNVPAHLFTNNNFPAAKDFAARLVTLPTHEGLTSHHIESTKTLIGNLASV